MKQQLVHFSLPQLAHHAVVIVIWYIKICAYVWNAIVSISLVVWSLLVDHHRFYFQIKLDYLTFHMIDI